MQRVDVRPNVYGFISKFGETRVLFSAKVEHILRFECVVASGTIGLRNVPMLVIAKRLTRKRGI